MFIGLNILCIIIVFFIGADVFSLADEIAYCKKNDIDIFKRKYSTCRECGHRLRIKDTFPVVSRLINKGKCRFCDAPLSKRGFNTEVAGGVFAVLIYAVLYYICSFKIFYAAAIMIAAVIVSMLITAWFYTPHKIKDKEEDKEKEHKEKEHKEKEDVEKSKTEKKKKSKNKDENKNGNKDENKNDDIALIEFNFEYKNKEE